MKANGRASGSKIHGGRTSKALESLGISAGPSLEVRSPDLPFPTEVCGPLEHEH